MLFDTSKIPYNIELMTSALQAVDGISYWCYDAGHELVYTNADDLLPHRLFTAGHFLEDIGEYFPANDTPLVLSTDQGVTWGIVFERENADTLQHIHVLGPVIGEEPSIASIQECLHADSIPDLFRPKFAEFLKSCPVIAYTSLFTRLLLLHYAATGEKLARSDIRFQKSGSSRREAASHPPSVERRHTYMAEQLLLRMVREGDLDYKDALSGAASISSGVRVELGDQLTRAKISGVTFTTLCVRAAIEGGLTPEMAYTCGDAYIQSLMNCKNSSEVGNINHTMYEDFIRRVHSNRHNSALSSAVRTCVDCIQLHTEEKLTISDLAQRTGYTEYYLSRKFKKETGISISNYIKFAKIERAKALLIGTNEGIAEISERLKFSSRNHFANAFGEVTGCPPAEFRKRNQKI